MPYTPEYRRELMPPISGGEPEREKKGKFPLQSTHIEGVSLKVDKDKEVDILKKTVETLYEVGKEFTSADFGQKGLGKERGTKRKTIVEIAKDHENLRGLVSEVDDWEITITPKIKREWNRKVLQESLGILYSSLTREDYTAKINIPQGAVTTTGEVIDREKVRHTVREALRGLGLEDSDISAIMKEEISMRLDEDELRQAVAEGRAKLPEEAVKEEIITWTVKANKLVR